MRLPLRRRNVIALSEDLPTNVVPSATMINTKEQIAQVCIRTEATFLTVIGPYLGGHHLRQL